MWCNRGHWSSTLFSSSFLLFIKISFDRNLSSLLAFLLEGELPAIQGLIHSVFIIIVTNLRDNLKAYKILRAQNCIPTSLFHSEKRFILLRHNPFLKERQVVEVFVENDSWVSFSVLSSWSFLHNTFLVRETFLLGEKFNIKFLVWTDFLLEGITHRHINCILISLTSFPFVESVIQSSGDLSRQKMSVTLTAGKHHLTLLTSWPSFSHPPAWLGSYSCCLWLSRINPL